MDRDTFEKEYGKVKDRLFTFLVRLTGDYYGAGEILQEAVYRAYRKKNDFQARASFSTWLYRIAVNIWKNQRKKSGRELPLEEMGTVYAFSNDDNPEETAAKNQLGDILKNGLQTLEENYRMAFLLKHMEGFSYREIAEFLGTSEEAARVRVYRARHALRVILRGIEI